MRATTPYHEERQRIIERAEKEIAALEAEHVQSSRMGHAGALGTNTLGKASGGGSCAANPTPNIGEIESVVNSLGQRIDDIHNEISNLGLRISPVLRESEGENSGTAAPRCPLQSPIGDRLSYLLNQADLAVLRLRNLHEAVCL